MYELSWTLRSKPDWQRKAADPEILRKWRQEALEQAGIAEASNESAAAPKDSVAAPEDSAAAPKDSNAASDDSDGASDDSDGASDDSDRASDASEEEDLVVRLSEKMVRCMSTRKIFNSSDLFNRLTTS
jgi:transposase-like protein